MALALAYLPFRLVYVPTERIGRVVAWLASGYREAPPLERLLILPSWLVFRALFLAGYGVSVALHALAYRIHRRLEGIR